MAAVIASAPEADTAIVNRGCPLQSSLVQGEVFPSDHISSSTLRIGVDDLMMEMVKQRAVRGQKYRWAPPNGERREAN